MKVFNAKHERTRRSASVERRIFPLQSVAFNYLLTLRRCLWSTFTQEQKVLKAFVGTYSNVLFTSFWAEISSSELF